MWKLRRCEEDVAFEALLEKRVHQEYDKDGSEMPFLLFRAQLSNENLIEVTVDSD